MNFRILAAAAAMILIATSAAEARHRHHYRHHHTQTASFSGQCVQNNDGRTICLGGQNNALRASPMGRKFNTQPVRSMDVAEHIVSHPPGCPWRLFCGCGASVRVFGHPVRDLYLATNWGEFPPAVPAPGMAAWRNGHVFIIEVVNGNGTVLAYDANSGGHLTRIHTVSLRGYHVVNPHGGRYASN